MDNSSLFSVKDQAKFVESHTSVEISPVPLAIYHNGPLKHLSMFAGVVERDFITEPKPRKEKEIEETVFNEGKRGRVIGLSKRSRKNLLIHINRNKFEPLHVFFSTLTYPREFPAHLTAKEDLRAFLKRLKRKFGKRGVMWRIENQKRGAPHFHCIVYLSATIPELEFASWASQAWYEIVSSGDKHHLIYGVKTELLKTSTGVAGYCSKYVAKPEEGKRIQLIEGRQWGMEGDFPEDRMDIEFEHKKDFDKFWRFVRKSRRVGKHKKQLPGHVGPGIGYQWKSFFCPGFHDDFIRLAIFCGGIQTEFTPSNFYH